jgi:hypothetical protein
MAAEMTKEIMLFVKLADKDRKKGKSGLVPTRLFTTDEECDKFMRHSPIKWQFVKFEVLTEPCDEGIMLYLFDPTGKNHHKEYGILSNGLYAQLHSGTAPSPESEKN